MGLIRKFNKRRAERGYAQDERRAIREGMSPEEAAAQTQARRDAEVNDYHGKMWQRRNKKKVAANEARAAAEANIATNVSDAQGLVDRDFGQSALADLTADPMDVAVQMDARNRMGEISREGFTDVDRQALNQAFMQSRQEEQAQRGAVMDAAARRGDTSGGNALMSSLAAQQGGANRANQFATDIGTEGRNRALQALGAYGQMGGDMRAQGVGEQVARGSAVDQFNMAAAGQKSSDMGMLMNARGGQAQYQLGRSDQLAPITVGNLLGKVGDAAGQVFGMIGGASGQGDGAASNGNSSFGAGSAAPGGTQKTGGSAARTNAALAQDIDPITGLPRQKPNSGGGGFGGSY